MGGRNAVAVDSGSRHGTGGLPVVQVLGGEPPVIRAFLGNVSREGLRVSGAFFACTFHELGIR